MTRPTQTCLLLLLLLGLRSASLAQPLISFFNEMKSPELVALFSDSAVIEDLKTLKAEIRMGIMDVTPERAAVIRELNREGIPVVAWLLLPEEQGYWFHLGNGDAAIRRYQESRDWARTNELVFKGIGLDMELDYQDVKLLKSDPWKVIRKLPGRLYDDLPLKTAERKYDSLLTMIRKDGYWTESYYASFVKDEVALGNTAIQQLTGFMDIHTDREIPMLYSSFMGSPDGLLTIYGKEAGVLTVGLGSTGGGIDSGLPTMTYEDLVHDINFASSFAKELHIFSLEGCVSNGFLHRLTTEQWTPRSSPDPQQLRTVQKLQTVFKVASHLLTWPTLTFGGFLVLTIFILFLMGWLIRWTFRRITKLLFKS